MPQRKLYIDSNVFFYSIIMDREYGKCCARIIEDAAEGKIKAYSSVLTILEAANALKRFKIPDLDAKTVAIASVVEIVDFSIEHVLKAVEIAKMKDISPYDALHYIIAKECCDAIVSADKDFDRLDIKRIDPKEYVKF